MLESRRSLRYGALKAMPTSTGCMAVALHCQLLPLFRNANDFSMRKRYPTCNCSRLPAADFGLPDFKSQQVPVQPDAMGLQAVNGERTTISIAVVTSALSSLCLLSIGKIRFTARKFPHACVECIW